MLLGRNGLCYMALTMRMYEEYPWLLELPKGVCVEGGAARSIARRLITGEYEPIRDIDLVCTSTKVEKEELEELALKFMADDCRHGHGIEVVDTSDYFNSRDFTINEVLITGREVICTPAAVRAYKQGLIKVSASEAVDGRTKAKALYLRAALTEATGREHTIDQILLEGDAPSSFHMALFLSKAMQRGKAVAESFTKTLTSLMGWRRPSSIVEFAQWLHMETDFDFRSGKDVEVRDTPMYRVSSNNAIIKEALDEFFNDDASEFVSPDEFTAEEWELCNY